MSTEIGTLRLYREGLGDNKTENGVNYARVGRSWIANDERPYIGKYGRVREDWLYCTGRLDELLAMQEAGELWSCLAEVDAHARTMVTELISAMARAEGLTESMKSTDFMRWIGTMNNCKVRAEEIVLAEYLCDAPAETAAA